MGSSKDGSGRLIVIKGIELMLCWRKGRQLHYLWLNIVVACSNFDESIDLKGRLGFVLVLELWVILQHCCCIFGISSLLYYYYFTE